jgi:predicted nucleic acid-binding protein
MNTQVLIDAIVQQTMVFIAQLATAGGVRAPLAHIASQVLLDLTQELQNQGVKKKVIADMFGMALRTYHRRMRELRDSRTESGRTLWEAVLCLLREREPLSAREVHRRFRHDDPEVVTGILSDLVASGLAYRAGRGESAVYRIADAADFAEDLESRREANDYLVWLAVYRHGPIDLAEIAELSHLPPDECHAALDTLTSDGRVLVVTGAEPLQYRSSEFDVPFGTSQGWEAAVLDHFQAMVSAIASKLAAGASRPQARDIVGGSTWSLDVWEGHPFEREALDTLARVRAEIENLRQRIDVHNAQSTPGSARKRVVCYIGQYVREEDLTEN